MNAIVLLLDSVKWSNQVLEMTTADLTAELAHLVPPGVAHPAGALYAHAVVAQDMVVAGMLKNAPPLLATTFAGQTGCSAPEFRITPEWSRSVQIDLPQFRAYAHAVYAATEAYVTALTEADLDQTRDLTQFGFGIVTIGWMLNALIVGHTNNLAGEISAIKGVHGAQGYPF